MYSQFLFADAIDLSLLSFLRNLTNEVIAERNPTTLEIEIKFGYIRKKIDGNRIELPIVLPSIITPSKETYFDSSISLESHRAVNLELNKIYGIAKARNNNVSYNHSKIKDVFYSDKDYKIRQSFFNQTTSKCIIKKNLKNLDIHYPGHPYDVRFSINSEIEVEPDALKGKIASFERDKDRISYNFPNFASIDLTQVTIDSTKVHELEIEFDMNCLSSDSFSESLIFVAWLQKIFLK